MTPFSAGIPFNQKYNQNFDFSGFPTLCEETYTTLQGLNPRLSRDIPYPGFFHSMNTLLQATIIDSVYDDGQRLIPGTTTRAQDILPNEYVIPEPIHEYLSNIGTVITPGGQMVKTNIPASIVPQPPDEDEEGQEIPSGTFGIPDDENHNAYEVNVCPYTTMRYVEVSALEGELEDWIPLPQNLIPAGGVATRDFLGYSRIQRLHPERRQSIQVGRFEESDDIAGRVRYNPALFIRCNTELAKLSDKFKMIAMGNEKGSRKYIKFKSEPGNLVLCEAVDNASP